jgi:hypothetical protein
LFGYGFVQLAFTSYRIQGDSAPTLLQADERKKFDQLKNDDRLRRFVVKVPRLPGGLSATSPEDDQFLQVQNAISPIFYPWFITNIFQLLRLAVKERFDLDHENLVELIGLDRSYGRYPGIVLEYCPYGDLTHVSLVVVVTLDFAVLLSDHQYKRLIVPYEKDNQRYVSLSRIPLYYAYYMCTY